MRINKTDGKAIVGGAFDHGFTSWEQIMDRVAERARHRADVLAERRTWFGIQDAAQESWE